VKKVVFFFLFFSQHSKVAFQEGGAEFTSASFLAMFKSLVRAVSQSFDLGSASRVRRLPPFPESFPLDFFSFLERRNFLTLLPSDSPSTSYRDPSFPLTSSFFCLRHVGLLSHRVLSPPYWVPTQTGFFFSQKSFFFPSFVSFPPDRIVPSGFEASPRPSTGILPPPGLQSCTLSLLQVPILFSSSEPIKSRFFSF